MVTLGTTPGAPWGIQPFSCSFLLSHVIHTFSAPLLGAPMLCRCVINEWLLVLVDI